MPEKLSKLEINTSKAEVSAGVGRIADVRAGIEVRSIRNAGIRLGVGNLRK